MSNNILILVCLILTQYSSAHSAKSTEFLLNIIHFNDFHARYEPIDSVYYNRCFSTVNFSTDSKCIGGFSRLYSVIQKLRKERPNALVFNAGDDFRGTIWYNFFGPNPARFFLNKLQLNASTIGNHEFDAGLEEFVHYIKQANYPVVVANIDDSEEPVLKRLYKKSIVLNVAGKLIGIVGVLSSKTKFYGYQLNQTNLKFFDESDSVNKEANRLVEEENVDTVIVLSHCGYDNDLNIAKNATKRIGLIIGGHSHTFLYTGKDPPGPDKPKGDYPTIVEHEDGRKILVVQASSFTKYLGNLTVYYDSKGDVIDWDGAPIFLSHSIPQDENINADIDVWRNKIKGLINSTENVIGVTKVDLDYFNCWSGECNIGDVITDAMVWTLQQHFPEKVNNSKYAPVGLFDAGGIKTSIPKGNITLESIFTLLPYANTWNHGYIKGKYIKNAIESLIGGQLMQVSGLKAVYDFKNKKVKSIKVKCNNCDSNYEDLTPDRDYLVAIPSFIVYGGDNLEEFSKNLHNHTTGPNDLESMIKYIKHISPVKQEIEERIQSINYIPTIYSAKLTSSGTKTISSLIVIYFYIFFSFGFLQQVFSYIG